MKKDTRSADDPRSLGRAISLTERGGAAAEALVQSLYSRTGRARLVGITGPPGSGKSTLVEALVRHERSAGRTVAVLAIDPTSPFSGGAILGDRVRMASLSSDPGVFIRSMATRGAMGGLAAAANDAVDVLDAAGFDMVIVETVGVGQDEVDVVRSVHTVAVLVVPGLGDDVQTEKAGILEIADVFVLNKADREGAEEAHRDLLAMLRLAGEARGAARSGKAGAVREGVREGEAGEGGVGEQDSGKRWRPPVVRTVATRGEGVAELSAALAAHHAWLVESGEIAGRRRERMRMRVEALLKARVLAAAGRSRDLEREVDAALESGADPYATAERLFAKLTRGGEG